MKSANQLSLIICVSIVSILILAFSTSGIAQTTSKGDTLIVGPLNSQGQALGSLNEAIKGDTTETGERAHKVYKLQRGAQYILTETIEADFPLVIVADKPDAENRPPIIRCGVTESGENVNLWWNIYDDATFKNLWISGINLDGTGPINWIGQQINAQGVTIRFEGCIIEYPYTWWAIFADWGKANNYYIEDCIFQYIGNPSLAEWNGAVFHHFTSDTLIVKNTTFFDFGCFAINLSQEGTDGHYYAEIDHCTFVNSMVHAVNNHGAVKQIFTNNLFVNVHSFSDDKIEIARHYDNEPKGIMNYAEIQWDPQKLDSLWGPGGVYGKTYDPNGDGHLTEGELVFELKNNDYYFTQPIKDYWNQYSDIIPEGTPWMNDYNKAMFQSSDSTDTWTWTIVDYVVAQETTVVNGDTVITDYIADTTETPVEHEPFKFFKEENTMNLDPGFVDINNTDQLLGQNCINIRKDRAGEVIADTVKWHGVDDYLAFDWPLNYDLSYTNATLKTAGTDGQPIGALHWWGNVWPHKVNERGVTAAESFELSQNYPNPFNPTTVIKYAVGKRTKVEIKVYDILGREVATLLNEVKDKGSNYQVVFNAENLPSGVYFYKLKADNKTITRKMLLMK